MALMALMAAMPMMVLVTVTPVGQYWPWGYSGVRDGPNDRISVVSMMLLKKTDLCNVLV
jgi:hypothetical protein